MTDGMCGPDTGAQRKKVGRAFTLFRHCTDRLNPLNHVVAQVIKNSACLPKMDLLKRSPVRSVVAPNRLPDLQP
jgi:hypothetical protein